MTRALDELKPEDLAASLTRMLASSETSIRQESHRRKPGCCRRRKKYDSLLDLVVLVHPRELDKATIRSLLADTLTAAGRGASPDEQKARDQLAATLEASRKIHPDDLSAGDDRMPAGPGSGEATRIEPALARLAELVDKTPLEMLAAGTRANARQRAEAARQVPLWLVARACWTQKNAADVHGLAQSWRRGPGRRRDVSPRRRSHGHAPRTRQLALARGDRAGAEAAWGEMLKLVVEPADRSRRSPSKPKKPAAAAVPRRATSMVASKVAGALASYQARHHFARTSAATRASVSGARPRPRIRQGGRSQGALANGVAAIELAALDPGKVRAGDADRAVGRRA